MCRRAGAACRSATVLLTSLPSARRGIAPQVEARDKELAARAAALAEKEDDVNMMQQVLQKRDMQLRETVFRMECMDGDLEELQDQLTERDEIILALRAFIAERPHAVGGAGAGGALEEVDNEGSDDAFADALVKVGEERGKGNIDVIRLDEEEPRAQEPDIPSKHVVGPTELEMLQVALMRARERANAVEEECLRLRAAHPDGTLFGSGGFGRTLAAMPETAQEVYNLAAGLKDQGSSLVQALGHVCQSVTKMKEDSDGQTGQEDEAAGDAERAAQHLDLCRQMVHIIDSNLERVAYGRSMLTDIVGSIADEPSSAPRPSGETPDEAGKVIDDLRRQVDELTEALGARGAEATFLENELAKARDTTLSSQEVQSLQAELAVLHEELATLRARGARDSPGRGAVGELDETAVERACQDAEISEVRAAVATRVLREQVAEANAAAAREESRALEATRGKAAAEREVATLTSLVADMKEQDARRVAQLGELQKRLDESEKENAQAARKLAQAEAEREAAVAGVRAKLTAAESAARTSANTSEKLQDALSERDLEVARLREQTDLLRSQMRDAVLEAWEGGDQLKSDVSRLREELAARDRALMALEADMNSRESRLVAALGGRDDGRAPRTLMDRGSLLGGGEASHSSGLRQSTGAAKVSGSDGTASGGEEKIPSSEHSGTRAETEELKVALEEAKREAAEARAAAGMSTASAVAERQRLSAEMETRDGAVRTLAVGVRRLQAELKAAQAQIRHSGSTSGARGQALELASDAPLQRVGSSPARSLSPPGGPVGSTPRRSPPGSGRRRDLPPSPIAASDGHAAYATPTTARQSLSPARGGEPPSMPRPGEVRRVSATVAPPPVPTTYVPRRAPVSSDGIPQTPGGMFADGSSHAQIFATPTAVAAVDTPGSSRSPASNSSNAVPRYGARRASPESKRRTARVVAARGSHRLYGV